MKYDKEQGFVDTDTDEDELLTHEEVLSPEQLKSMMEYLQAIMPDEPLPKSVYSAKVLSNSSFSRFAKEMIMQRLVFRKWLPCKLQDFWKMAIRIQFAVDTIDEIKSVRDDLPKINKLECFAVFAVLVSKGYDDYAAGWVSAKTEADAGRCMSSTLLWPPLIEEYQSEIDETVAKYREMLLNARSIT